MDDISQVEYDYRQHDRIWRRVAPSMMPYPEVPQTAGEAAPAAGTAPGMGYTTAGGMTSGAFPAGTGLGTAGTPETAEERLPGAVSDPCCMGSAARDDLAVLEGFRDQETADRRYYRAMLRTAPPAARPVLRDLMARKQAHSRYLGTLSYLITGQCRPEIVDCQRIYVGNWCPALRQRYHEEACAGFNYLRAAEGTTDPCLQKAYRRLSEESYQQSEWITELLEKALSASCSRPGMGV